MTFDKPTNEFIKEIITANLESDGWAQLAKVGAVLRKKGVNYGKLSIFFNGYNDLVEIKSDDSVFPPVAYVKIKGAIIKRTEPSKGTAPTKTASTKRTDKNEFPIGSPKDALKNWAWLSKEDKPHDLDQSKFKKWLFDEFQKTISGLNDLALGERWHYHSQDKQNPYPILINYLAYTFYRLSKEKGKIIHAGNYAAFNTGLVDKRYEPIYALFVKTRHFSQPYRLIDFCIAGEDYAGKTLVKNFSVLPARAHYFNNISDMLFDTLAPRPQMDMKHILIENIERLPLIFLEEYAPRSFEFQDTSKMNYLEKHAFFERLGEAIEKDSKSERNFTNRLKDSLELSLKRVQWNFKTAIPQYFPTMNTMSVLLPLCLVDDEKVDVALVAEKTKSGNYLGHTILPLEWAYSNARLVSRPDSDWLIAEKITPTSAIDKFDLE
jgi:hypothetical protein